MILSFNDELSKPYTPKTITILDIFDKVDNIFDREDGGYSSSELIESTKRLKEVLQTAYEEVKLEAEEEKQETLIVAIESTKTLNTKEIIQKYRAMPGQDAILDIDAYKKELAEKFAKYEPYFKSEYELYEKYQDVFTP